MTQCVLSMGQPLLSQIWPNKNSCLIGSLKIFIYHSSLLGVKILIDSKAQLTLLGTEMDYVENKLSSEFVFHNPNVKGTCGCGESFHVE